jgi:fucose permease
VLFLVGIGTLAFVLVEAPVHGFSSPAILVPLIASAVVLVGFAAFELHSRDPMMDVRVFANIPYTASITTVFSVLFCVYGTLLVVTQYFQNIDGYSALATGFIILAFSIPQMVMAPIAGRLAARLGGRRPTLVGLALARVGTVLLAVGVGGRFWVVVLGLFVLGLAAGLAVAPATAVAMASIRPERPGMASGILSTQRGMGSTAGFAIMGTILAFVVAAQLPAKLEPIISDPVERSATVDEIVQDANRRPSLP